MPIKQSIGVPSETRINDQRQIENEEASRRYSTMIPVQNIKAEGQFLQKVVRHHLPGWMLLGLWVVFGLPCLGLLVAEILAIASYETAIQRFWGILSASVFPTVPLLILLATTRNWIRQRKS